MNLGTVMDGLATKASWCAAKKMAFTKWVLPLYNARMVTNVTLDKAGRIVIPKGLRDDLRLAAGDMLSLEYDGNSVVLRPVRSGSSMRKEQGIWVFRGGQKITAQNTDRILDEQRNERDRALSE